MSPVEVKRRRTMRRSRFGCRNCKLRKLKCDEAKPGCKRCSSFGVLCNFMSGVPDLQPISESLIARDRRVLVDGVWTSDASTFYQLDAKCQDFVTRYLARNLMAPDDPNMVKVNQKLLVLAFAHPYLMHASLAVAFAYDRHLNTSLGCRRSLEEYYHFSQSTTLFNKRLREPLEVQEKDPIWGAAAAMAVLSFASPDAYTPEESWPLKPSDPSDLEWLSIGEGKMLLWHIINPLRRDSIFSVMASTFAQMHSPLPEKGIGGIPVALAIVCNLDDSSTAQNNPYFKTAHAISEIYNPSSSEVTTGQTQLFINNIRGSFKSLLEEKEPVALLLLYLWYRKASRSIWWVELRARVECPSICLYLQLYHKENSLVQAFLPGGLLSDRWSLLDVPSPERPPATNLSGILTKGTTTIVW